MEEYSDQSHRKLALISRPWTLRQRPRLLWPQILWQDISRMYQGIFFKIATNLNLDFKMNWLNCRGQTSLQPYILLQYSGDYHKPFSMSHHCTFTVCIVCSRNKKKILTLAAWWVSDNIETYRNIRKLFDVGTGNKLHVSFGKLHISFKRVIFHSQQILTTIRCLISTMIKINS